MASPIPRLKPPLTYVQHYLKITNHVVEQIEKNNRQTERTTTKRFLPAGPISFFNAGGKRIFFSCNKKNI